jgi:hypothetical protein
MVVSFQITILHSTGLPATLLLVESVASLPGANVVMYRDLSIRDTEILLLLSTLV